MRSAPSAIASAPAAAGGLNLRTLLRALPLLGTLPMLAFAVALLWQQWTTHQQATHRSLERTAQAVALSVERELNGSKRQLEHIGQAPSLQPGQLAIFHGYLQRLIRPHSEWDNLALVDPQGTPLLDANVPLGMPMPRAEGLDFRVAVLTGTATVSDLYISPHTGRPAVVVAQPVQRDGRIVWVLAGRLADAKLRRLLYEPAHETSLLTTVMDGQGLIIARSQDFDRFFGTPASPDMLGLVRAEPHGMGRAQTADGRKFLFAWQRLDNGWTVSAGVDPAALKATLLESLSAAAGAGALLLLLGLASATWLSRRIGAAIDQAAENAITMAQALPVAATHSPISQVNRLLAAHQEASRRLTQTALERNEAMERMRAEVRRRDEFLSMLAHELRNPLAPLGHALWLLEHSPRLDAQDQRRVAVARSQARQLHRLVDDLLDASRLINGKITLKPEPLSLRELVERAAEAMQPLAEAEGQQLVVELPADPVTLIADGERISQVLHNLLGNAVKFGRPQGTLRVTLQDTPQEAVVSVSDEGTGIEPGRLEELFLPFCQIEPDMARSKGGLGLGLTIARQLVQMHGGSLSAHSAGLGQGATFTLRLPREAPPPALAAAEPAQAAPPRQGVVSAP